MDDADRKALARIRRLDRRLARVMRNPGVPRRLSGARAVRFEARRRLIEAQAKQLLEANT